MSRCDCIERFTYGCPKIPEQPNSNDCGFYVIHNCDKFLSDPERYRDIISVMFQNISKQLCIDSSNVVVGRQKQPGRGMARQESEAFEAGT